MVKQPMRNICHFLADKTSKTSSLLNTSILTIAILVICLLISHAASYMTIAIAHNDCRTFFETNRTVCGRFLDYWSKNGELRQQGFPISDEIQEKSEIDGKVYKVQYFERAVFEAHPENQEPYDVLLSLLGGFEYKTGWGKPYWPVQTVNNDNPLFFSQTGKTIGGKFRAYWEQNGGLSQQGYPISNEFQERNLVDDKLYTVQYFERSVFELHPENQAPYDVLLSLLGRSRYNAHYNITAKPTPLTASISECRDILKRHGTTIAQGTNTIPTGRLNLKTYRVEEIPLAHIVNCPNIIPPGAERFWRIYVTAEEPLYHYEGGNIFGIFIDRDLVGSVGAGDGAYNAYTFNISVLHDGGTVSLGPGFPFLPLTERLHFNKIP